MNTFIISEKFYDFQKEIINIGGVETYIADVVKILIEMGIAPTILQRGEKEKSISLNGYIVKQLIAGTTKELVEGAAKGLIDSQKDLVIFGTDTLLYEGVKISKTIAIQHGIWWDKPNIGPKSRLHRYCPWLPQTFFLKRAMKDKFQLAYRIINRLRPIRKVVCVDYNYSNWYRSLILDDRQDLVVIPNYTRICESLNKPTDVVNIIFARRLVWYRGTRIFTGAIKRILGEYNNIKVTIAGTGPEENWMHEQLQSFDNVSYLQYKPDESMAIHADKHIAVVPTVGSEGTSLSLLEAMSAQCATICTDVGGMTSIVLDGYNGKMVRAGNEDDVYEAIRFMLDNPGEMKRIAEKGYETAKVSFSYERWKQCWKKVLEEAVNW